MARARRSRLAKGVIELIRDGAELQLSRHTGDGVFGSVNRVYVEDVDARYVTFRQRGLNTISRPEVASSYRASQSNLGAT